MLKDTPLIQTHAATVANSVSPMKNSLRLARDLFDLFCRVNFRLVYPKAQQLRDTKNKRARLQNLSLERHSIDLQLKTNLPADARVAASEN